MANEQNLRPPFNPEEAREYGRKGGIKSAESRREHKTIKSTVEKLLNEPVTNDKHLKLIEKAGMPMPKNPTYKDYLAANTLYKTILRGDIGDLAKLIDMLGESNIAAQADTEKEDALSRSLRELAEGLESDY